MFVNMVDFMTVKFIDLVLCNFTQVEAEDRTKQQILSIERVKHDLKDIAVILQQIKYDDVHNFMKKIRAPITGPHPINPVHMVTRLIKDITTIAAQLL